MSQLAPLSLLSGDGSMQPIHQLRLRQACLYITTLPTVILLLVRQLNTQRREATGSGSSPAYSVLLTAMGRRNLLAWYSLTQSHFDVTHLSPNPPFRRFAMWCWILENNSLYIYIYIVN
jgi:hypothetical protein